MKTRTIRIIDWLKTLPLPSIVLLMLCVNSFAYLSGAHSASAATLTYTSSGSYVVPANVTSLILDIRAGGGQAGAGCDIYSGIDGAPGGASSITYNGAVKAIAYGGGGGLAVDTRCYTRGDGANGTAVNYGLTSATITTGGGSPGEIADGDSYTNGGNGGAGGKITGTLAVTPGQVITITVGNGYNGNGWIQITEYSPTVTYTSSGNYTVPANVTSLTFEIGGGGGYAGAGCDIYSGLDGTAGGSSSITYDGAVKAIAYGGGGGLAVDSRCYTRGDGANGIAVNYGLTSATITTGGGAPGEIADGDSYANGGNGGNGGKITGALTVTPGQAVTITVGNGYNNGWVKVTSD